MTSLDERVAIVTGGGHGIGRAYCGALATEGARVVVADVDPEAAGRVVDELGSAGREALAVHTDVTSEESVDRLARTTIDRFGRIDVLVSNAAFFLRPARLSDVPFEEIPLAEWDRVMAVNVKGVFLCCRAVA